MSARYFSKLAALIWAVTIVLVAMLATIHRPTIDTSMMSLLPASKQQPLVKVASETMGRQFAQRLLLLVSAQDTTTRQQAVAKISNALQDLPQVETVISRLDGDAFKQMQQTLFPYRFALLSDELATAIDNGDTEKLRQQAVAKIINPVGLGSVNLTADPFGLLTAWLQDKTAESHIKQDDGYLQLTAEPNTYLVMVNLAADAFSRATQQRVLTAYQSLLPELAEQGVQVASAGLLIHADAGARQAQKEMSTIGVGSLIGILFVMFWVFRQIRLIALLLLPVVIGCIVATSVAFLVFERVHIVTFAFGAGLIGVAIDYALHFLCERQVNRHVIKLILPGLSLGLASSVLAYGAQAIAPFPGLRQMALFSAVGLTAAWLTVVLWLPLLTTTLPLSGNRVGNRLMGWQQRFPSLNRQPKLIGSVLVIATLLAAYVISSGKTEDDIRLLQTSPPELMAQEQKVQTLLGDNSSTQFLLLPCEQLDHCLEDEQRLKPVLETLRKQGVLMHYSLVSDELPSLSQQQLNATRSATLYQLELAALFTQLKMPDSLQTKAMEQFLADADKRLQLADYDANELFSRTATQIITGPQGEKATAIRFAARKNLTEADIAPLKDVVPTLVLVDQVEAISSLMQRYRQQILLWVTAAYLFVFLILVWRYKMHVGRIILPPFLASVFTVAILMIAGPGINLFHMMALLLVLGVGMDMGIFLTETRQALQTWLAVSLSVLTSLMAFGLLALSQTPVLKHFGITVLLGLTFVWILSTVMRQQRNQG